MTHINFLIEEEITATALSSRDNNPPRVGWRIYAHFPVKPFTVMTISELSFFPLVKITAAEPVDLAAFLKAELDP